MATYAQIASITVDREREDGTTRSYDIRLHERDAAAEDLFLPIEGGVVITEGSRDSDLIKPIVPTKVKFRLKDDTDLADRIIKADKRQFKLTIDETTAGLREFEGYIKADLHKYDIFRGVQTVELTATGELATLDQEPVQDGYETLHTFFDAIGTEIELDRDVDFYTRLRYNGQLVTDPIPELIRVNELEVVGADSDSNRYQSISQMLQQMNWQLFQHNGRLVVADAYERMTNPTTANKLSGPTYGQSNADLTVSIGKNNAIRYPSGQRSQRIAEVIQQQVFRERASNFYEEITNQQMGIGGTTSHPYPGIALGGDEFTLNELSVTITKKDGVDLISGTHRFGRIVFESYVGGPTYYYNGTTGEWDTQDYQYSYDFLLSDQDSEDHTIGTFTLPPIPEDELGEFRVEATTDFDLDNGSESDFESVVIDRLSTSIKEIAGDTKAFRHYKAGNGDGQSKVYNLHSGDLDRYNADRFNNSDTVIEVSTDGGSSWSDADRDWVDPAGNGPLAEINARRKASLLVGYADRIHLRTRALEDINPLTVIGFDDGGGVVYYSPVCIQHNLFGGYYEIWMKPAPGVTLTESNTYSLESAGEDDTSAGGTSGGGSAGGDDGNTGTIPEHGELPGLGDDDHPQYFNEARGDARYVRPNTTPTLDQVILNNPASADNHALRAGQVLQTTAPITGGDKLRNGPNIGLSYNSTNLATPGGVLDTIQDIHTDADVTFRTLALALGLTLDDSNGYVQSETFVGDFGGSGVQLRKQNGKWRLTIDDVVVRNQMKIYELLIQQIQAGASFLLTEGHRVDEVTQVGDGAEVWDTSTEVWDTSSARWTPAWKCYIPEDMLLQLDLDDLIKRQQFSGRNVGVTNGTVVEKEAGSATVTDNTPRRSFTIYIEDDGSQPPEEGFEFARIGNLTDPDRQGGIIMTSSDDGAPYQRIFANVDSHSKFGDLSTIMSQSGRLDNLTDPDFTDLDGTQNNLYGEYIQNAFVKGKIIVTGGNAATKEYVDEKTGGGTGNVAVIQSDDPPSQRDNGDPLQSGDIWYETDQGNEPHVWDTSGTGTWVQTYTEIDGGRITTGIVDTDLVTLANYTMDKIADGSTYARVKSAALTSSGLVILSQASGNLDDINDGGTYAKVNSQALDSSGIVKLAETIGSPDDIPNDDGSEVWDTSTEVWDTSSVKWASLYQLTRRAALTSSGLVVMEAVQGNLDDVDDGSTYAKVKLSSLTAEGLVVLSAVTGDLDDINDGGTYAKVLKTEVSAGHIVIEGPNGNTVIDQGTIDTDALFANTATITTQLTLGTNGVFTNPSGDFRTDENGYQVAVQTSFADPKAYTIKDGTTTVGGLWGTSSLVQLLGLNGNNVSIYSDGGYAQLTTANQFVRVEEAGDIRINLSLGDLEIAGLPTSAPSDPNKVWNDGGTLKIT